VTAAKEAGDRITAAQLASLTTLSAEGLPEAIIF